MPAEYGLEPYDSLLLPDDPSPFQVGKIGDFEKVEVDSATGLRRWLCQNHLRTESVWLVTYKKCVPEKYVSTHEILDELLCVGWIDGVRRRLDEQRTMQLISPRKAQHWSGSYKDRAARLKQEGRMQGAGLAAIAASKRDGSWTFMDDVDALVVPNDLHEALSGCEGCVDDFNALPPSYKRNVLRWVKLAKTVKTRRARIEKVALATREGVGIPQM